MRESDVIVSPSRDEAMPTVTILEAMALGKALITTIVGGAWRFWSRRKCIARPAGGPDVLATVIRRLIEDPALAGELQKVRADLRKEFHDGTLWPGIPQHIAEWISEPAPVGQAQCLNVPRIANRSDRRSSLCLARDDVKRGADSTGPIRSAG